MVHNLLSINTYNTVGLRRISFFSEIRSPRSVVTPFFLKRPLPPPKKCHRSEAPIGLYGRMNECTTYHDPSTGLTVGSETAAVTNYYQYLEENNQKRRQHDEQSEERSLRDPRRPKEHRHEDHKCFQRRMGWRPRPRVYHK